MQQLNYLEYIDIYKDFIRMFHVKDAEFNPTGRQGMYSGYQSWGNRAGRFRSTGDGQVDFKAIFSKLAHYDYEGWATLEWECCLKIKTMAHAKVPSSLSKILFMSPIKCLMTLLLPCESDSN